MLLDSSSAIWHIRSTLFQHKHLWSILGKNFCSVVWKVTPRSRWAMDKSPHFRKLVAGV
jgi:hypothetical protein